LSLTFQSLCSGSSGNSLLLKSGGTTLLIDAGFPSMRGCRRALGGILSHLDGAVISHLHSDHIQYSSLRVLEESRVPIYVCEKEIPHLAARHYRRSPFLNLKIRPFFDRPFQVGDFSIHPFRVPHDGVRQTFGFEVTGRPNGKKRKVVVATDFWHWQGVSDWFEDADFIYVEANHDRDLLRANPNPRSHFHLSNENCGRLLRQALDKSRTLPQAVMLGHLSEIRNRFNLARDTVLEILDGSPHRSIPLHIAPRYEPSEKIEITG
jgi:phosphoribosyl 1,2-cyclic phosphodiesterase